jgi:hypothetical protein
VNESRALVCRHCGRVRRDHGRTNHYDRPKNSLKCPNLLTFFESQIDYHPHTGRRWLRSREVYKAKHA